MQIMKRQISNQLIAPTVLTLVSKTKISYWSYSQSLRNFLEMEYLGYIIMRAGIKPQQKKVQVILAITPPKQVKDLHSFLDMVQYYRDL